eukprot:365122-Chlamydomonas_euryale.AAC.41
MQSVITQDITHTHICTVRTNLCHEARDDAMEGNTLVMHRFAVFVRLLASDERLEVFDSLWYHVSKQPDDQLAHDLFANLDLHPGLQQAQHDDSAVRMHHGNNSGEICRHSNVDSSNTSPMPVFCFHKEAFAHRGACTPRHLNIEALVHPGTCT